MTTTTTIHPRYGAATAEIVTTAADVTDAQAAAMTAAHNQIDDLIYQPAANRLGEQIQVLDPDGEVPFSGHAPVFDAVYAVLTRDRGLITDDDFELLTRAWTAAGLPLPAQVTGDDETGAVVHIPAMTSDLIADELLHAAHGTEMYAAVLALTGFNLGGLLAYPMVRDCVRRSARDQSLYIDWRALGTAVDTDLEIGDLDEDTRNLLDFAISLAETDSALAAVSTENAEVLITATAYKLGVEHLINDNETESTP